MYSENQEKFIFKANKCYSVQGPQPEQGLAPFPRRRGRFDCNTIPIFCTLWGAFIPSIANLQDDDHILSHPILHKLLIHARHIVVFITVSLEAKNLVRENFNCSVYI